MMSLNSLEADHHSGNLKCPFDDDLCSVLCFFTVTHHKITWKDLKKVLV